LAQVVYDFADFMGGVGYIGGSSEPLGFESAKSRKYSDLMKKAPANWCAL
jgi:hypothetical protein